MLHLGYELAEILTHADSRFWRTLRRLALDPAGLTRDYLSGRRASEIPPLRLFFVILLLLFGVGSLTGRHVVLGPRLFQHQPQVLAAIAKISVGRPHVDAWLRLHLGRAAMRPDEVLAVMREWLERFTLLMLPISGLMLWGLYLLPRRGFTLYDHLVLSIHSLSFVGSLLIALLLLDTMLPSQAGLILLALPVHLFAHLRGVYRSSVFGTLLRMLLLFLGTLMTAMALLLGLAATGLAFGTAG